MILSKRKSCISDERETLTARIQDEGWQLQTDSAGNGAHKIDPLVTREVSSERGGPLDAGLGAESDERVDASARCSGEARSEEGAAARDAQDLRSS
eukprot:CAMPEP_0113726056 /NCGR_PEP_ID=MMETSP0038_2-20120614/40175_1 /TAXON_ID=2898 /ORGANISM="Cryptomonas paramecium" /LENGTH=95 /DNA_ID=CAMNT_0000656531 /DNA_START=598 /DNA_END=882 /DNA_ORIENTATION=+ /assembly_acc=CAM_ASM_000170